LKIANQKGKEKKCEIRLGDDRHFWIIDENSQTKCSDKSKNHIAKSSNNKLGKFISDPASSVL
jgi:hypothetical protein